MKQFILFAALVFAFAACTPKQTPKEKTDTVMVEMNLKVNGMTCDHCEESIRKSVAEVAGVDSISANHEDSTAFVRFDSTQTNLDAISKVIGSRGFEVVK